MASILRVTDGTNTISLLKGGDELGFHLEDWTPAIRVNDDQNVVETFALKLTGASPNALIHEMQELRRLLIKAKEYQDDFWRATPYWIEARQDCEDNTRYAPIIDGRIPEDDNPYSQPFLQQDGAAVMDNLTLLIERGDWLANKPGESTCVQTSALGCASFPAYIEFNGTTTEIDCGSDAGIDDLPGGANGFTAEAWVRANDWGENDIGRIFDKQDGNVGWYFNAHDINGLEARFDCAGNDAYAYSGVDEWNPDSDWHHVVVQFEDTTRIVTLGIDGQEVQSYLGRVAGGGAYAGDAAEDLHIGNRATLDATWDGDIGWARISDIERYTFPYTVPERCTLPDIDANTVGQWIGAELGGATISNQQGDPLWDGTLANGVFKCDCYVCDDGSEDDDCGEPPFAVFYNAVTTRITVPDHASLQNLHTNAFCLEAWIRPDGWGEGDQGHIISKTDGYTQGWYFNIDNTRGLVADVLTVSDWARSRSGLDEFAADGEWKFVTMQYDDDGDRKIYLWVDGVPIATYTLQQPATGAIAFEDGSNVLIGDMIQGFPAHTHSFEGPIGWTRITSVSRYTNGVAFTPPPRCNLPSDFVNVPGQWIGVENSGLTIDNQQGTAATDGTLLDGVYLAPCPCTPTGQEATCEPNVYITNKHNRAQLSHIFTWSAANGFSANLIGAATPFDLVDIVGAAPAVDDYVIFGIQTTDGGFTVANSGPFDSLVLDLITVLAGGLIVDDWEYSDGGAFPWPNLIEQDNTWDGGAMTAGASPFDTIGVNSVHWLLESAWVPQAINGVTAYWVRAVVTAAPGGETAPAQDNRDIYTITEPYIEVAAAQVGGDLNALARIEETNVSQNGSVPLFHSDYLLGIRDCARGEDFSAYINFADEQNPPGVQVAGVTLGSLAAYIESPTGWALQWNPVGLETLQGGCFIDIEEGYAWQYSGTFHAFLRGYQENAGAVGDLGAALAFQVGDEATDTMREFHRSETQYFQSLAPRVNQVLDMGQVTIPRFVPTVDRLRIILMCECAATAPDGWFTDIILLPTDEWSGEFTGSDFAVLGTKRDWTFGIDAVRDLRDTNATFTKRTPLEKILARLRKTMVSPPILLANKKQRIWTFGHTIASAVPADDSSSHTAHRCQSWCNQRYLSMRGAR